MRAASRFRAAILGFRALWSLRSRPKRTADVEIWTSVLKAILSGLRCRSGGAKLQDRLRKLLASLLSARPQRRGSDSGQLKTCYEEKGGGLAIQVLATVPVELSGTYQDWVRARLPPNSSKYELHFPLDLYRDVMQEYLPSEAAAIHIVRANRNLARMSAGREMRSAVPSEPPEETVIVHSRRTSSLHIELLGPA